MADLSAIYRFDSASATSLGCRDYQEDCFVSDFAHGADTGFAVLADGMGGHAAGDVASQIVVAEVFSQLTFLRKRFQHDPSALPDILKDAAVSANNNIKAYTDANPQVTGMGTTLVACVILEDALHWISIGDSPLYLFRGNQLHQVNEEHSMVSHVDMLVNAGELTKEEGRLHPDRYALTSALYGRDISLIDCPTKPLALRPGDTIIIASDGLQFLTQEEITEVLRDRPFAHSADLVDALMKKVEGLGDPDLDNVTLGVVQVQYARADHV